LISIFPNTLVALTLSMSGLHLTCMHFILQQLSGGQITFLQIAINLLSVSPDTKKGIIWINTTHQLLSGKAILKPKVLTPPSEDIEKMMISQKHLNLYNKIANHIQNLFK